MPSALRARGAVFVQAASPEVMHGGCQKACMETALDTRDPLWLPLEIHFFFFKKKKRDGCCLVGQLYGKPASKHQPRREGKSLRYGAALTPKLLSVQPWFYVTENLVQNNRSFLGFKAFVAVVQSWHYTSIQPPKLFHFSLAQ